MPSSLFQVAAIVVSVATWRRWEKPRTNQQVKEERSHRVRVFSHWAIWSDMRPFNPSIHQTRRKVKTVVLVSWWKCVTLFIVRFGFGFGFLGGKILWIWCCVSRVTSRHTSHRFHFFSCLFFSPLEFSSSPSSCSFLSSSSPSSSSSS